MGSIPVSPDQASGIRGRAGRLTARVTGLSQRRPEAPRNFRGRSPGVLSWTAPPPTAPPYSHYRIRIDTDAGNPAYELSSGHTEIQILRGSRFVISTYNQANGLESSKVYLNYNAAGDITTGGTIQTEELQVTAETTLSASSTQIPCNPTPTPGVRLVWYIAQDATGGREITWASCYKNAPIDIDGTASTLSVIAFVARIDPADSLYKWYFDGSFSTGLATL